MGRIRVVIAGSGGRMGKVLLECVAQADDLVLHAALEHTGSPLLCNVVAEGVKITADMDAALKGADVLIDFTSPDATRELLGECVGHKKGMVIGKGGRTIKALGQTARARIEALIGRPVFLDLHVKVLPKWRRDAAALKRLGYTT